MNSKFLNKLNQIQDEEKKNEFINDDILRYSPNKISFWLCILAIVCNVAMFLIIYTEKNCTPNWQLGIDLLINVLFMLASFLLSEKTKAYKENAGKASFVIAAIQVLRIFWIPLFYYLKNVDYVNAVKLAEEAGESLAYTGIIGLNIGQFIACIILLTVSALSLVGAGLICNMKAKRLKNHIAELEKGRD